jgi:hypothetical protein
LIWILHKNATGAAVSVDGAGAIDVNVSGEFAGGALVLEGSFDGANHNAIAAPIRSPGQQRINTSVKHLRPAVAGGADFTCIVVTLTTSPR